MLCPLCRAPHSGINSLVRAMPCSIRCSRVQSIVRRAVHSVCCRWHGARCMRAMFVPGCALHVSPSRLSYPVTLHPNLLGRGQTRKAGWELLHAARCTLHAARCIVPRSAAGEVARRLGVARLLRRLDVCANRVILPLRRCDHRHARRRHTHADDSQLTLQYAALQAALNLQPTGRCARLGVRVACVCGKLQRRGAVWMRRRRRSCMGGDALGSPRAFALHRRA